MAASKSKKKDFQRKLNRLRAQIEQEIREYEKLNRQLRKPRRKPRYMVLRTIYLTPEMDDRLRVAAFRNRTSKNKLIRRALEKVIEDLEKNGE